MTKRLVLVISGAICCGKAAPSILNASPEKPGVW